MKKYAFDLIFIFTFISLTLSSPAAADETQPATLRSFGQEFIQLVKNVERSAVAVDARMGVEQGNSSEPAIEMTNSGAGFILDSNRIVVKQKVVSGSDQIDITLYDKSRQRARIVGSDDDLGLAYLAIDAPIDPSYRPRMLNDPARIATGEPVLIISNSLGIMPAASFGIVNCTRSDGMIQLSADLPAGTSGGGVFNFSGELIGLVALQIDFFPDELPYSSDLLASETVLVTPIRNVRRSMTRALAQAKKRSVYFGVMVDDWPSHLGGAHIKRVYNGSPAESSGIKTGDIILSTDNRKVANAYDLYQIVSAHSPGDNVTLQILRGDEIFPCTVKLTPPPENVARIDKEVITSGGNVLQRESKKIDNDYLNRRLQKLEVEIKILKEMMTNR
ncbi:serine protease [candidate division KSB1 bacterium]|nr:serine protease [candidate division KSB1 bacterium]